MAQGDLVGYYPLYRSGTMKAFDQDDGRFLKAAAPYIAHGLKAAKLITTPTYLPVSLVSFRIFDGAATRGIGGEAVTEPRPSQDFARRNRSA
jgi:hypothetical protein